MATPSARSDYCRDHVPLMALPIPASVVELCDRPVGDVITRERVRTPTARTGKARISEQVLSTLDDFRALASYRAHDRSGSNPDQFLFVSRRTGTCLNEKARQ